MTDDTAVGTVSPTGDCSSMPLQLPAGTDAVTALVGLDSHDHPWDEQPPPIVDLGDAPFAHAQPRANQSSMRHRGAPLATVAPTSAVSAAIVPALWA